MDELMDLARRQGYITAAQARSLGANEHTLGRLADAGALDHAVRGIFLVPDQRHPSETHALLTRATLDGDPFARASHHSALALHGVALYGVPWLQVHLADPRHSSRGRAGRHRHVLRADDAWTEVDGYRTVGVPLALAQVAARFGVTAGVVALDNALADGRCTADDVAAVVGSGRLRRGLTFARRALALADARAESPGESRLRTIIAGSPFAYDLQVNMGGPGSGYRVDLLVADVLAVEFDGGQKYEGADGKKALVAEKVREDYIRKLGFGFLRVTWPQLDYPTAILRSLHSLVLAARITRAASAA